MWKSEEQKEAFLWLINRKFRIMYEQKQANKTRKDITMKRAFEYAAKRRKNESAVL